MTKQTREENPFEDPKMAQEWIDAVETERGKSRENEIYPLINYWTKENNFKTVLEVGSGQGVCSPHVETDYIGVEPSQFLIDRANNLYPNKKFIKGSSYNIPLEDESVESAFSVGVWFHIENLNDAHKELFRVLKPGGKILIITSNPEAHDTWESLFVGTKVGNKLDGSVELPTGKMTRNLFFLHTKEDIVNSLNQNGFEVTNTKNLGFGSNKLEKRANGLWIAIEAKKLAK